MVLDKLLESNPSERYARLERRLRGIGRDISSFRTMTIPSLYEMEKVLESSIEAHKAKNLRFVLEDVRYQRDISALKALRLMIEHKEARNRKEKLTPGRTYYRDVVVEGTKISGLSATYLSERDVSDWRSFSTDTRILKVFEVLSVGTTDDFRKLYVEMADGRVFEALSDYVPQHITESSAISLDAMAQYCDERWEGPWPWESRTPFKLFSLVKEARMTRLEEIRKKLIESRRALQEGEVERADLVVKISGIRDVVASTIQRFGKLSGDFLTMGELVAIELGDEAKSQIDQLSTDQLRALVDQLTQFQQAVDGILKTINGEGEGAGMAPAANPEFDAPGEEPADEFGDEEPSDFDDLDMGNMEDEPAEPGAEDLGGFGDEREMRA